MMARNIRKIEYVQEYIQFHQAHQKSPRFEMSWSDRYACLDERTSVSGFDAHYTYHSAWAARVLSQTRPSKHIDIASSLHFCTLVSAFVPIDFYDYRPAQLDLSSLESKRGDLMQLPFFDNSVESISCMHVVEHIGLGRYGDPIDPEADLKAISELKRVTTSGGTLLFVTPVGRPRIQFNAHRIYSYEQIVSYFPGYKIKQFALVKDDSSFVIDPDPDVVRLQIYGCGCWWFEK